MCTEKKHSLSCLLLFYLCDMPVSWFHPSPFFYHQIHPVCSLYLLIKLQGPLYLSPTQHSLTFSRSGQDDSLISSLDPPPAHFSLHSPPFAELPPYRGICVGVDEGSFCSVQGHLHQWKRVGQGLPVSPSPSWHSNCSRSSSSNASCFIRDHSSRTSCCRWRWKCI